MEKTYIIGTIELPENYWTTSTTVDDFNLNESN